MAKLRVVFMGTPDFAVPCLEMLVAEDYDIAAVVTQPDRPKGRGQKLAMSPVKETAVKYGLKVLQPEKIKDDNVIAELAAFKPDVIIVVAFGQFLPKAILDMPQFGCINVHASLLPTYRGAAPIHWAVINGEKVTGVTTMYMDIGMDTGDMILKVEAPIGSDETTGELYERLKAFGAKALAETLVLVAEGKAPRIPQDSGSATYASLLKREHERIDWEQPATIVHNLIRGLNPWPGAYCVHNGKTVKVWKARVHDSNDTKEPCPGRIVGINEDGILVKTGQGLIELIEIQPESKRSMKAVEYARGYGISAGDMLE